MNATIVRRVAAVRCGRVPCVDVPTVFGRCFRGLCRRGGERNGACVCIEPPCTACRPCFRVTPSSSFPSQAPSPCTSLYDRRGRRVRRGQPSCTACSSVELYSRTRGLSGYLRVSPSPRPPGRGSGPRPDPRVDWSAETRKPVDPDPRATGKNVPVPAPVPSRSPPVLGLSAAEGV